MQPDSIVRNPLSGHTSDTVSIVGVSERCSKKSRRNGFEMITLIQRVDAKRPALSSLHCGESGVSFTRSEELGAATFPKSSQRKRSFNVCNAEDGNISQGLSHWAAT